MTDETASTKISFFSRRCRVLGILAFCLYSCYWSSLSTVSALSVKSLSRRVGGVSRARAITRDSFSPLQLHMDKAQDQFSEEGEGSSLAQNTKSISHAQHAPYSNHQFFGRRGFFRRAAAMTAAALGTSSAVLPSLPANAGALLQFPIGPETQLLKNKYHFMRAGTSELEADGIYSTNPLFLTNRENAMAPLGEKLILQALEKIKKETEYFPTVAYHSLAANGMDTGDLIARQLRLGREKLLPEFTYLDQRGVGLWDAGDESLVKPAVWALDYQEAGKFGMGGRPPANEDGTPNETLGDQFIRLRQFISLQESRTAGEIILVIFPDGTGPALLSSMIAGIPFRDVHALEFAPGEVRLDISPESVRQLYEQKKNDPEYLAILEDGKEKLERLRKQGSIVGLKEQKAEQERLELEAAFAEKKKAEELRERERQAQAAREKQLQLEAQREARAKLAQAQKDAKEERERQRKLEAAAGAAAKAAPSSDSAIVNSNNSAPSNASPEFGSSSILATGALGVAGLALAALGMSGDESKGPSVDVGDKNDGPSQQAAAFASKSPPEPLPTAVQDSRTAPPAPAGRSASLYDNPVPVVRSTGATPGSPQSPAMGRNSADTNLPDNMETTVASPDDSSGDSMIDDHLNQLAVAEQAMRDALQEAATNKQQQQQQSQTKNAQEKSHGGANTAPNNSDSDMDNSFNGYYDDGGTSDWLRIMMEIRDESDEDDEATFESADLVINGDSRKPPGKAADL